MLIAKKILSVLLVCAICLCSAPLAGFVGLELSTIDFGKFFEVKADAAEIVLSGSCGENVTYTLDSDGLLIISGTGDMTDYSSGAAPWHIYNQHNVNPSPITKVIIENGITKIGKNAFYECEELTFVDIPNSVKIIGVSAFRYCSSLSFINIPNSVVEIDTTAFADCIMLTSIVIPSSVKSIGHTAFSHCESLPTITIPESVTSIGNGAFYSCYSLGEIIIENTDCEIYDSIDTIYVSTIVRGHDDSTAEYYALKHNFIFVSLDGANSDIIVSGQCGTYVDWMLTRDGNLSITGNGIMKSYDFSSSVPWDKYRGFIKNVCIDEGITNIGSYTFYGLVNMQTIAIPETVVKIEDYAFNACKAMVEIKVPDSVTSIESNAFFNCPSLTAVAFGENSNLISIGENAFAFCSSLYSITIPASVTNIGITAFDNCISLFSITIINPACTIADDLTTFSENSIIIGHENSTAQTYATKYDRVFLLIAGEDSDVIDSGHCGENITWTLSHNGELSIIGTGRMYSYEPESAVPWYKYRNFIRAVFLADGIMTIGNKAFYQFTNLHSIVIPKSVKSIESYAFYNCTSLLSITIFNPKCLIDDSQTTIFAGTTIIGYDNSTAKTYARKYSRTFEILNCIHDSTAIIPAVAVTCTQTGLTQGTKCTVCGEILVPQTEIPVLNHADENTDGYCDHCATQLIQIGDVDGDGQLTSSDARAALRAAVGLDMLTAEQKTAADADGDNNITSADARLILRAAVGLEDPKSWLN